MPATPVRPFINGHRYSFASIDLIALGQQFFGVTRIAYGSSLKPGIIRGSDSEIIGRTPGEVEHRCALEMYQEEFETLVAALGNGFGLIAFDVTVMFDERIRYAQDRPDLPSGVTTHHILGCRISDVTFEGADGVEANTVRVTLEPTSIGYGGINRSINWRPEIASDQLEIDRSPPEGG